MNNFKYKNILFMLFVFSLVSLCILNFPFKDTKRSIANESEKKYIFTSIERVSDIAGYKSYDIYTNCNSLTNISSEDLSILPSLNAKINSESPTLPYFIHNKSTICFILTNELKNRDILSLENINLYGNYFENAEFIFNDNNFSKKSDIKVTIVINENSIEEPVLNGTYTFNSINDYPVYCYKYNNELYKFGDTINIDNNITVEAILLDFEMEKGASIRLSKECSGMRFATSISKESENSLTNLYENISYGTIIVPTDKIKDDFIIENFDNTEILNIPAKKLIQTDTYTKFTGVITNIYSHNFLRNFSSRGYIKINLQDKDYYIYTTYIKENNSRNVFEISKKAKADTDYFNSCEETEKNIINSFINNIVEINIDYSNKTVTIPSERLTDYNYQDNSYYNENNIFCINIIYSSTLELNYVLINGERKSITKTDKDENQKVITIYWEK